MKRESPARGLSFRRTLDELLARPNPKPAQEAFEIVREWLAQPGVAVVHPGPRHVDILEHLVTECGAAGPMVTDAALAALAPEYGATLASNDRDFSRFPELRWVNPIG